MRQIRDIERGGKTLVFHLLVMLEQPRHKKRRKAVGLLPARVRDYMCEVYFQLPYERLSALPQLGLLFDTEVIEFDSPIGQDVLMSSSSKLFLSGQR